jgi:hypothetical protein
MMNTKFVARVIDVKGAFLKGKFVSEDEVLMLEVPQGFRWLYDKLGDEVEKRQTEGNPMEQQEVKDWAKEIFQLWMNKTIGEKVMLLWQQKNPKGGARKVYLQMHRTIYGSVQAARAFWVELNKAFQAMGYTRCDADPCLYVRWDEDGEVCMWLT